MSETAADAPAPTLTLLDQLRERLNHAPAPMTAKELAQGLTRPKKMKAPEFEASLPAQLSDDLQAGRAFKHPSGKAGAERYWAKDEKQTIQHAVLSATTEPKKLADLKKVAKEATKADKSFADALVDDMVAAQQLHEQAGKGPPYGREKYISPNNEEKVREAILSVAANPTKLADLIAAAQTATKADKKFVTTVANEMVTAGLLHAHGKGKSAPFAKEKPKPPHSYEIGQGKKDFDKLVKAARTLLESVKDVPSAEMLERLRVELTKAAPQPKPERSDFTSDPADEESEAMVKKLQEMLRRTRSSERVPDEEIESIVGELVAQFPTAKRKMIVKRILVNCSNNPDEAVQELKAKLLAPSTMAGAGDL